MNPLFALLNQQAAAGAVSPNDYQGQIDVVAQGSQPVAPKYEDFALNNVPAIRARDADIAETEEASQRRGLFGVKGTLRDVLGVLGDAFLIQSGNAPMYAPTRRRERISDAWAGASEDPIAAAERVGYYDAGMGQELLEKAKAAKGAEQAAALKGRVEDRQGFDDATKRISQAYAAVMQNPTPEAAAYALQLARNESQVLGIPLERLGVTPEMTQDVMRVLAGRGATVSQTMNLPLAERRVAVSEQQLGINKERLEIALRGVKNQEARTRIAEQVLGLRRDDQEFDQMMDLMGLSVDVQKAQNADKPEGPRTVPGASRFRPVSQ